MGDIPFDIPSAIASASKLVDDALNKIWPDPAQKATAEAIAIKASSDAAIAQMAQSIQVMLAEAQSSDKWTSRARPSFLYVMYTYLLTGLPMSVLYAVSPETAKAVGDGIGEWLRAIPTEMWTTFAICFTGYTAARSYEKKNGVTR